VSAKRDTGYDLMERETPQLLHVCEDGHSWREQPDGGVSPSWGMALTTIHFDGWNPRRCPEPERDENRQITCQGCGTKFYIGHGTPGVMCDPWNFDERCQPAPPVCGKPPIATRAWLVPKGEKHGRWVDFDLADGQMVEVGAQLDLFGVGA
jgi:hypothetical protein